MASLIRNILGAAALALCLGLSAGCASRIVAPENASGLSCTQVAQVYARLVLAEGDLRAAARWSVPEARIGAESQSSFMSGRLSAAQVDEAAGQAVEARDGQLTWVCIPLEHVPSPEAGAQAFYSGQYALALDNRTHKVKRSCLRLCVPQGGEVLL